MKKTISILLSLLLLLGLLAGCSNTTTAPAEDPAQPDETPADGATDAPADETPAVNDNWLPLVDEPEHLSMWLAYTDQVDPNALDPSFTEPYQIVEQQTGVIVDFDAVSNEAANEQFSLMLASGDHCDIIARNAGGWPGGISACIDQEILMDVSDLVTGGFAPHYQALREADGAVYNDTMEDSGAIAGFYRVLTHSQKAWLGLYVSRVLAEEEGFDVDAIAALEEWEAMLTAFAAREDVTTAYELTAEGKDAALLSTFNIPSGENHQVYFRHVGEKVECSYISDDYYAYLQLCRSWIDKGIINPLFNGETPACFNMDVVAGGGVACFRGLGSQGQMLNQMSEGLRDYVAVPSPLPVGSSTRNVVQTSGCSSRAENAFHGISASCSNPELAVRWCDYFYSDEAFMLVNYGIEDITYTKDENGEPQFTDFMLNNPDHFSWENLIYHYGLKWSFPCLYKWDAQLQGQDENTLRAYGEKGFDRFYDPDKDLYTLPLHISMTQEESELYTSTFSDIQTYIDEMTLKFLTGAEELNETTWENYKQDIERMGIQDCVDVLENAYIRYLAR